MKSDKGVKHNRIQQEILKSWGPELHTEAPQALCLLLGKRQTTMISHSAVIVTVYKNKGQNLFPISEGSNFIFY